MEVTGKTRVVGIIGDPVSHSLSPQMQNAAFSEMGLDICYIPLHVTSQNLGAAISGVRAMEFVGANVTIPHKVIVMDFIDQLADTASLAGAVNTIVNQEGLLIGHNTDGEGFIRSLDETTHVDYENSPVFIAGAGGAARALSVVLAARGVPRLTLFNRTEERAAELKSLLNKNFPSLEVLIRTNYEDYGDLLAASKVVINTTPLGMEGQLKTVPMDVDKLSEEHVVCDIVYTRSQETPLLIAARGKGAKTLGGAGMLLHQGAVAIQLWTGEEPPINAMRRAIEPE